MSDQTPPKLIVDDDWKSEAKREKEKLSAKAEPAEAEASADPRNRPIEFTDLVRTFASQAAVYLGLIPEPQSQQRIYAPEMAKLNIDFLSILEDKTKGNLSDTEKDELAQTVVELRALFVETNQAVAKAMEEGKLGGGPGATPDLRTPTE